MLKVFILEPKNRRRIDTVESEVAGRRSIDGEGRSPYMANNKQNGAIRPLLCLLANP